MNRQVQQSPLSVGNRVVVKVGSSLLVDAATGTLNRPWLKSLVGEVVRLKKRGKHVMLVSSGAISLGSR